MSLLRDKSNEYCPKCGQELVWRQQHRYPIISHIIFGLSFVAFLFLFNKIKNERWILWSWTAFQATLGVLLVAARLRAKKRVLHCIRCSSALR
ncbi:MAG: hypothetical protein A3K03_03030 [Bdellovibrionales bacterium RIFOXYD1_FULL_44_7]|nr:MAG: hypothetical protein A3K03_03030 [Bdellovibrionales bacterium RIFOXYD1_FULL_44_7]